MIFLSAFDYIQSCTTITAQIAAIDQVIAQLIIQSAKASLGENMTQYSLNDGQTIISTTKRSVADIQKSIIAMRRLRNDLISDKTGRMVRLVDGKNLNGCHGF
jgi:chemotaxis protein histidine kinase CheA